MKKLTSDHLTQFTSKKTDESVTFEQTDENSNIIKAQVYRDGRKHELLILAVPEDVADHEDSIIENRAEHLECELT